MRQQRRCSQVNYDAKSNAILRWLQRCRCHIRCFNYIRCALIGLEALPCGDDCMPATLFCITVNMVGMTLHKLGAVRTEDLHPYFEVWILTINILHQNGYWLVSF